jgi:signal transduction histidine kinase/ActR/RegA family two-component response regulator
MQSDLAGVFESGHDTKTVRTVNLWDRQKQRHSIVHGIPVNENPEFQEAIEREFVVYADDVLVSPAHRNRLGVLEPLGIRAILIADTFSQQPGIGYVGFAFRQPHHWTRQEIAFARGVANLVALLFASNQNAETLATLDQVSEAIYAEDRFGALQYANRAARALHGAAPEQNRFPRPDNPLAGESDVQEIQHEGRDLEIRRLRLPNAGVLTRISDVTARNAVATTRLQYEARLQQSVKMEAIGQLAGGIAHDFNNILGSILGFAGFLVQDLPERSAEHGFAERILSACERGKGLIEQILAFASASAVERGAVELDALLKRNQKNLTGLLPERVRLSISLPEVPLPILGSATQIGQLVANLCNNACDAFGDGSGTINIAARPISSSEVESLKTPVRASHERQFGEMQEGRSYCLLEVEDDGPGIAPDILDRVFEPFFTTKGRHRSAGLGLAVVHGVVVSTGGVCRLTSIPGKRTVFSIYFPLASEAIVEKHHRNQSAIPRGGERVLIVDDEPDIADMLAIGLERLGYRAVGVNDPLEALAAFEEDPEAFDAVVTDQVMPGLRGLDLIQRLKEIRPEIKAILCTGYSDGANEDVSRAAGADAYFHKPVEATQIARQIRILADRKN